MHSTTLKNTTSRKKYLKFYYNFDWVLFLSTLPLVAAGLIAMYSFSEQSYFFNKQVVWVVISVIIFFALGLLDLRFLKRTDFLVSCFIFACFSLVALLFLGASIKGAQSWFNFGGIAIQPADPVKILVILILAKYFSRRHIEIANIRHILVSGFYAFIPFMLILLQPDFGSAMIIFFIWLGMASVSGISKKHLIFVFIIAIVSISILWFYGFTQNQKNRIISFIHPLTDIRGTGYNAYQSTIAVGSGGILGKGVGYGTQSRLEFLPEYETDFIFAAFSEEWGFIGSVLLFICFGVLLWRILANAMLGATNFEILYGVGLAVFFVSHIAVHIGMNIGILPVTGLPLPFVSYGGSHLLTEFAGLGILMSMRRYGRAAHKEVSSNEFVGV